MIPIPYQSSVRFVWSSFQGRYAPITELRTIIENEEKSWEARVYQPADTRGIKGLITSMNGFSVYGDEDIRVHNICRAMASSGYRVIQPTISELNNLQISVESVPEMASCLKAIATSDEWGVDGKVALFAPSFTAGLGLLACAHPLAASHISAICAIGTFADIDTSVEYLLTREGIDDYGRLILMRNFVELSLGDQPELMTLLDIAIRDNGFKRTEPEIGKALEECTPETRKLYEQLQLDASFRKRVYDDILKTNTCQNIYREMNVLNVVHSIQAPVTLIHGADDDVIPASESELLHKALLKAGKRSNLLLTPLLTHGDIKVSPGILNHAIRLIQAFDRFFTNATSK